MSNTINTSTNAIQIQLREVPKDSEIYDILNRAVFYVSRLVSSQKERDFVNTNYNDLIGAGISKEEAQRLAEIGNDLVEKALKLQKS